MIECLLAPVLSLGLYGCYVPAPPQHHTRPAIVPKPAERPHVNPEYRRPEEVRYSPPPPCPATFAMQTTYKFRCT
jgi:hypothetical protein